MYNQSSIEIECPIEYVFELTNNNVAEWSLVVVEEAPVGTSTGIGSKSTIVTEDRGQRMEFETTVTEYDPPRRSAVQMVGSMFDIDAAYDFEALGGNRTRVTQHSTVRGKGLMRLFFFGFGWLMQKSSCEAGNREMQSLKQFCETHS